MPSPPPSPSSPPPSASFFEELTTNEFQDHMTHPGNAARPFIGTLGGSRASVDIARDLPSVPNLNDNVLPAGTIVENTQSPVDCMRANLHGPLVFQQVPFHGQQNFSQESDYTLISNNHMQEGAGYAQNLNIIDLNAPMNSKREWVQQAQVGHHHVVDTQRQPQHVDSHGYHGQAASQAPPASNVMETMMANMISYHNPGNWDHNLTMGTPMPNMMLQPSSTVWGQNTTMTMENPQSFQTQNGANLVNYMQLPTYQQNSWAHDPSLMMQPQMTASFGALPMNAPIVQRTPCYWPSCTESFTRSTDIQRHIDAVHLGIRFHCFWIGCPNNGGKGYCRAEKLRTHQRQKHGST